jgi:pimeloyl-ACP methyl ester carboxylesterase
VRLSARRGTPSIRRALVLVTLTLAAATAACSLAGTGAAAKPGPPKARAKHHDTRARQKQPRAKPKPPKVIRRGRVRIWTIHYRAHTGAPRAAYVVLPAWYGPRRHPPIPLVISPHGRGVGGSTNARLWGQLPALGTFAVVNPDGQGRRLPRHSWGYRGQIDDLARMPTIIGRTLPWLRLDRSHVYAFGGSMGGQETLLLVARHPHLLAGAAVFDAVTDFGLQYRRFRLLACNARCRKDWIGGIGSRLRVLARREIGGAPKERPTAYRVRSPVTYSRMLAFSCVPLQIWWSVADRIVTDQQRQSGRLFWLLRELNPYAPVQGFAGFWIHSAAMRSKTGLPYALAGFGLLPQPEGPPDVPGFRVVPAPPDSPACTVEPG